MIGYSIIALVVCIVLLHTRLKQRHELSVGDVIRSALTGALWPGMAFVSVIFIIADGMSFFDTIKVYKR